MAKTAQKEKAGTSDNESKKQRKKQAKQEAKAMLKLEQAKQDEQKAEQKAAKAQALLEARRTNVRKLEAKVAHTREPHQLPLLGLPDAGSDSQSGQHDLNGHTLNSTEDTNSPPANQVTSPPPVEGRIDVGQEQTDDMANSPEYEDAEPSGDEIHLMSEDTNQQ